jgi:hypothetical protein
MTGIIEPIIAGIVVSLINRFILNKQNILPLLQQQQQQGLTAESTAINSAASVASSNSSQNNGVVHLSH